MSDQEGSGFVVEPANSLEIHIAVGAEAELTPALRQALDDVVRALEAENNAEVVGFGTCKGKCAPPGYGVCNPQKSDPGCTPKVWFPCFAKTVCSVIVE